MDCLYPMDNSYNDLNLVNDPNRIIMDNLYGQLLGNDPWDMPQQIPTFADHGII